jgi:uncharacterized MAPEG superfamily protein
MSLFFGLIPDSAASGIWAMVVASLLPLVMALTAKAIGGFNLADNAHPRDFLQGTTGAAARANAAQQNSYETLPIFLAAVLVAYWFLRGLYYQFSYLSLYSLDAIDGLLIDVILFGDSGQYVSRLA